MIRPVLALAALALVAGCAAPSQQRVQLPATPHPGEPGNVAGLTAAQVRVAFGEPAFVRKDGKVEIWRYDGAGCKGFFFFYPAAAGLSVRHVETVPRGRDIAADTACLDSLLIHRAVPSS
ncbi:MAG TPA: hypothetical protein VMH86_05010 [Rhizomicrobium sp.]|nr:hypothetical protein [Rhizomicrobium sp.]